MDVLVYVERMPDFKDHFSGHARAYGAYRPHYPAALYDWIASLVPEGGRAWDCATGNGQAACALAEHFDVVATDASAQQIAAATPHPRVRYTVAPAEASGLDAHSVDLVTVAQALHWFDVPAFAAEVERVLRPSGLVVAWCYALFSFQAEVDGPIASLYHDEVGPYWPPERDHVEAGYQTLPWPWETLAVPDLAIEVEWTLEQTLGYLRTWSASRRYLADRGQDPVERLEPSLRAAWGSADRRRARFPLSVLASRPG